MQCSDNSHQENEMRFNKWRGTLHNVSKVVCGKKKTSNQEQASHCPQNTFIQFSHKVLQIVKLQNYVISQNTMKFSIKQRYLPWKEKKREKLALFIQANCMKQQFWYISTSHFRILRKQNKGSERSQTMVGRALRMTVRQSGSQSEFKVLNSQTSSKSEWGKKQGNEDWQSKQTEGYRNEEPKELNRELLLRFKLSNDLYLNMKMFTEKYSENLWAVETFLKAHDQATRAEKAMKESLS